MNWETELMPIPEEGRAICEVMLSSGKTCRAIPSYRNFDVVDGKIVKTEEPVFNFWTLLSDEQGDVIGWKWVDENK